MTIRVYGDSISGNCLKVKWTLDYLGIPYLWTETNILKGESRTPDFLAMNPAGQVPAVILSDGRPLAQSNAIIGYFAEGSALVPKDAYERARMWEWMFWEQYSHEPYVAVARFQVAYLGKAVGELEPKLVERANGALKHLDNALAGGGFLVGDQVSLADVALVAYTRMAPEGGFDLALYPAIEAWIKRVEATLDIKD
jgi:glutathione S-transferase